MGKSSTCNNPILEVNLKNSKGMSVFVFVYGRSRVASCFNVGRHKMGLCGMCIKDLCLLLLSRPDWPGDVKVPVADCNREQYGSHVKIEMSLGDYLDYWLEDIHSRSSDGDTRNGPRRILYLKDWHFCR